MKFCPQCGKEIKVKGKFCVGCGVNLEKFAESSQTKTPKIATPPVAQTPVPPPPAHVIPKKSSKIGIAVVAVVIAAILIIAGVWVIFQKPENGGQLTSYQQSISTLNTALGDHVDAVESMQKSNIDLVGIITEDYTKTLNNSDDIDTGATMEFMGQIIEEAPNYAKAFLTGYEFLENWVNVQEESESTHHSLILTAIFIAGIGLLGYGGYKTVKKAVNKNVDIAEKSIQDATDAQLNRINEELGLPVGTSKANALAEFQRIRNEESLSNVNTAAKNILAIETLETDVSSLAHANEVKQTQVEIAVELGEGGVNMYAGAITTVTGGQGVSQLGQAVGLSETGAAIVDLGVSAAGYQPLDVLGKHVSVVASSKEKKEQIIDKPESEIEEDTAIAIIEKAAEDNLDEVTLDEFGNALDTIATEIADKYKLDLETVDYDDYKLVKIPLKYHLQTIEDLENAELIKIPDLGLSDFLISSDDTVPDVIEDIDTSENPNIGLDWEDLDDADPVNLEQYSLSVIASPSDPAEGQSVLVTARITPATSGVEIYFHITGTDGYSDTATTPTGSEGTATFSIPGAVEGTVDTVTIRIVDSGIERVFSYVF